MVELTMDSCGNFIAQMRQKPINGHPTGWGDEVYYYDGDLLRHYPPRTKQSHPYSYDPIVLIDTKEEGNGSAYSDRMMGWDPEKFRACMADVGEMRFQWGNSQVVQRMARAYFDDVTLKVVKVIEMCNSSTGYPVWLIVWKSTKEQKA